MELLSCCGSRRWAARVSAGRPYTANAAVLDAADAAWDAATEADVREAFAAHPRIGEPERGGEQERGEQAASADADAATREALREGNLEYERRFGHIYLVFASGRSASELLEDLRGRLGNDPRTELAIAAEDPLGQLVPFVDVAQHGLAAAGVELRDAEALDVVLVREAELLLDLELHRQPVTVPARLARHVVPLHRLVAGEDVLEHAAEDVVRAGSPVGGRRALVEDERLGALAAADRLVENVALAPALEHALLEFGERLGGVDWAVASHEADSTSERVAPPWGDDIPPRRLIDLPANRRTAPGRSGSGRGTQMQYGANRPVVAPGRSAKSFLR